MTRFLPFALVAILAAACNRAPSSSSSEAAATSVRFVPDATDANPAVELVGHGDGSRITVDVVAHGASDVHGAAFRLTWDPSMLEYVQSEASDAWSRQAISLAKEAIPGQLVVAWAEKGDGAGVDATEGVVLGSITFGVKRGGASLKFKTERSELMGAKGVPIAVAWRGGAVK